MATAIQDLSEVERACANLKDVIHDPKLILMDEPVGTSTRAHARTDDSRDLWMWQESKKTIIFVTRSIQEAVFLGSHCAVPTARPAHGGFFSDRSALSANARHEDDGSLWADHPAGIPCWAWGDGQELQ